MPAPARAYVAFVALAAFALIVPLAWATVDVVTLVALAAISIVAESVALRVAKHIVASIGFPIALAGVLLLPPSGAALIVLLTAFSVQPAGRSWIKAVFNGTMLSCSAAAAGYVYLLAGGSHQLQVADFPAVLLPALLAAVVYCVVNGLLLAGIIRLTEGVSLVTVWRTTFAKSIAAYLGYGLFGLMMAALWHTPGGWVSALLILLPLHVSRWVFAQYARQQEAYDATVRALVQAVETKDYYTRGHSERVARAAEMMARVLGLREERVDSLKYAGILHDVGKLGVPTRVLQKAEALTESEFASIQLHPVRGLEMVRGIRFLREAYDGILHHHERMDGRGYPAGLRGHDIPEFARIIAVADAFDSMTSTRSYRHARSVEEALGELGRCAGVQFDPVMVEALETAVGRQGWVRAEPQPAPDPSVAGWPRYDHDDPTTQIPVVRVGAESDETDGHARHASRLAARPRDLR
ncbi:MAG: HD-GYP domain-containing protein [Sporichthyaceae bacterium]|nr:HD-GYP domain-containing protein [Sporichthyaceae bacterium]